MNIFTIIFKGTKNTLLMFHSAEFSADITNLEKKNIFYLRYKRKNVIKIIFNHFVFVFVNYSSMNAAQLEPTTDELKLFRSL